jgi:hypothetical protein
MSEILIAFHLIPRLRQRGVLGASHDEPVLGEGAVLAWLQAHGVSRRTGPLSQTTMLVGVRVVD